MIVDQRVLLLNQNYEPLSVCSARRAIVLLFQGKAEMISRADGVRVHTVRTSYALPSVVRLWQYRHVPYKRIMLSRKNIMTRDNHQCQYCGTKKGTMTVDHVIPRKRGGKDVWTNLVAACTRCNNKKGDLTPERAGMTLRRKPTRPTYINFIQRYYGVAEQWRPYLFIDSDQYSMTT